MSRNDPKYPFFINFWKLTYFNGLDEFGEAVVEAHGTEAGWLRENISASWYDALCIEHLEARIPKHRIEGGALESTLERLRKKR